MPSSNEGPLPHVLRSYVAPLALLTLGCLPGALADLPIHCTLQDAAGTWKFHLGHAEPIVDSIPGCGHRKPNSVLSMLEIDRLKVVPLKGSTEYTVKLTEEVLGSGMGRHLKASGGVGGLDSLDEGNWTMVFDTGFEARIGQRSLATHFLFEALPNATAKNGDGWTEIGLYRGKHTDEKGQYLEPKGDSYACHCDVSSTGWWHRRLADGSLEGGCMWGSKEGKTGADGAVLASYSDATYLVRLGHNRTAPPGKAEGDLAKVPAAVAFSNLGGSVLDASTLATEADRRSGALVKEWTRPGGAVAAPGPEAVPEASRPRLAAQPAETPVALRGIRAHRAAGAGGEVPFGNITSKVKDALGGKGKVLRKGDLPKIFDWREELAGMVKPGEDPLGEQIDQGACGSCYAFAGIMTLQMRFRAKLWQQHKLLYPLELSYKSATRCSPYTEGCSGGFSFFTSRLAMEIGVPLAACDQAIPASGLDAECDGACYKNASERFYGGDYWHVGGFSHGSNEERIMREIYLHGPIELGFSTKAIPEFVVLSGQSFRENTDVMTVIVNKKAAKETYSSNKELPLWWWSTHAIIGVGWGEDEVPWGTIKYWSVRNSWGRSWGEGGYAYMRRGNNDGGIENDACAMAANLDRLPPGFLEQAKAYHAEHEAERREWTKGNGRVSAKKGSVEYCKMRPDSPDCN